MKCSHVQRRLSAYLDHETTPEETRRIADHLASCSACAAELRSLADTGTRLRQLSPVSPAADFRARFWERVRREERHPAPSMLDIFVRHWIPVPLVLALLIVVFSGFTVLSPLVLAAADVHSGTHAAALAKNTFAGFSGGKILGPLNYAEFCDHCHDVLCGSCCGNEHGTCPMGGNHD